MPSTHPAPVMFPKAGAPLSAVGLVRCTQCYEVGSPGTLGGQHLDRRNEWCRCHLSRLALLVLLEDNIWTEGMSGADVTCSIGTLGGQHLD